MQHPTPVIRDVSADATTMTWPRWRLVLLLMVICFVAHFNRQSMPVAADLRIMEQYGISTTSMGGVYSAFLIAYTLCMIPGGWLIDSRGPRFALQMVCFGSAIFVVLTGCVGLVVPSGEWAVVAFVAIRALMGMLSAPLHPAAATAVSLHIPAADRSAANGWVTGAALLGVASTFVLFGGLIDRIDWPAAFILAGLMTLTLGALWTVYAPRHASQRQIAVHAQASVTLGPGSFLRRNKNLLLLTLSYAAVGYFQYLFFYWVHYYFDGVLKLGNDESRVYATYPPLAMALTMPLGGWMSDRIQSRFSVRAARAGLAGTAMATSAGLLLLGLFTDDTFWIVTWLTLALGALGAAEGAFWVTAVEVGGRRGGLSASIFNTGGNAGGILSPIITPWISDTLGFGWQAGIAVGSLVCLSGAVLWYWIDFDLGEGSNLESPPSSETPAVPHVQL